MMRPHIKVEQALCKWCTNKPIVRCEVCIHFHPKSHFCLSAPFVSSAALVSTDATATAVKEYCSASHTLHCTTFHQMFPTCGASGQEHTSQPSQPELRATVTPAWKPTIAVPSSRPLPMVWCNAKPCVLLPWGILWGNFSVVLTVETKCTSALGGSFQDGKSTLSFKASVHMNLINQRWFKFCFVGPVKKFASFKT